MAPTLGWGGGAGARGAGAGRAPRQHACTVPGAISRHAGVRTAARTAARTGSDCAADTAQRSRSQGGRSAVAAGRGAAHVCSLQCRGDQRMRWPPPLPRARAGTAGPVRRAIRVRGWGRGQLACGLPAPGAPTAESLRLSAARAGCGRLSGGVLWRTGR